MTERVDIAEIPAWIKKLEGRLHEAALRGLLAAALRTKAHIITSVIPQEPRVPVDRGIYRAGWQVQKLNNGAYIYNPTPHASIIEDGARAENIKIGAAMIQALIAWVKRKGLTTSKKGTSAWAGEAESIAWAIAKNMQKNGIFNKGHGLGIMRKARTAIPRFITEEVTRELKRIGK